MLCADHKEEGLQERGEARVNIQGLGEGGGRGRTGEGSYYHPYLYSHSSHILQRYLANKGDMLLDPIGSQYIRGFVTEFICLYVCLYVCLK